MCYQSKQITFGALAIQKRAKWTRIPDSIKPQTDPMTWFKAVFYLGLTLLIMLMSSGLLDVFFPLITNKSAVKDFVSKEFWKQAKLIRLSERYLLVSVILTIASPVYWNVFCRYEYYTKNLSRMAGSPSIALILFAVSILMFSSLREWAFLRAIHMQPSISLHATWMNYAAHLLGYSLIFFGIILSMSGFYQLGIFGTYMGEYFGFMFDQKIESFPFNYFCDPMYFGSTLMHFGRSILSTSPTGIFLSALLGFTYWLAARCFEGPFMNAMYAARNRQSS
ncbi:hypothetical protein GpartN1_g5473.t1 [Galdieria partita]|uniref:Phosphatidylethanolamine N-methyltransferase n=1 Tax=Galdieria partita TaxID=83374 RepID=A0A9C7Q191_9RHOD|nr:hypothetical protein GpartN1_g5473.t1 [Galdieria partita]